MLNILTFMKLQFRAGLLYEKALVFTSVPNELASDVCTFLCAKLIKNKQKRTENWDSVHMKLKGLFTQNTKGRLSTVIL